jgi:hypothetical protein
VEDLLYDLVATYAATAVAREIWRTAVVSVYPNLAVKTIHAYMNTARNWVRQGSWPLVELIICNMEYYNNLLGADEVLTCECETADCCDGAEDDDVCSDEEVLVTRSLNKRAGAREFTPATPQR